jgi:hypothetical protein
MTEPAGLESRIRPDHPDLTEVDIARNFAKELRAKVDELNDILKQVDDKTMHVVLSVDSNVKGVKTQVRVVSVWFHKNL